MKYKIIEDLPATHPGNFSRRDLAKGTIVYSCGDPYGCCDEHGENFSLFEDPWKEAATWDSIDLPLCFQLNFGLAEPA